MSVTETSYQTLNNCKITKSPWNIIFQTCFGFCGILNFFLVCFLTVYGKVANIAISINFRSQKEKNKSYKYFNDISQCFGKGSLSNCCLELEKLMAAHQIRHTKIKLDRAETDKNNNRIIKFLKNFDPLLAKQKIFWSHQNFFQIHIICRNKFNKDRWRI